MQEHNAAASHLPWRIDQIRGQCISAKGLLAKTNLAELFRNHPIPKTTDGKSRMLVTKDESKRGSVFDVFSHAQFRYLPQDLQKRRVMVGFSISAYDIMMHTVVIVDEVE